MDFRHLPPEHRLPEANPARDKLMQCGLYPLSPLLLLVVFTKITLPVLLHPRPHLIEPGFSPWLPFLLINAFLIFWFLMSVHICLQHHHPHFTRVLRALLHTLFTPADRLLPADPFADTLLGFTADGSPLTLSPAETRGHTLIVGSTQTGKSTLAALWAAQQSDRSLLVIDPHAALVHRLLADGILRDYPAAAVFPLIPGIDFVPGWNLLQPLPGETPADCARRLTNVATDIFFAGDLTAATRFRDVLFHTAWALSATGWTAAEINIFLRSKPFRAHIARRVTHLPVLHRWLTDAAAMSDTRWRERTESTTNRFGIFQSGEPALIFGQRQSTLDVDAFLRLPRALWLAPLTVDALHADGAYLAAAMLLALTDARLAHRRKNAAHPPLLIVADEFQRYPTAALERLLTERAGFGASLLLVTQGLYALSPVMSGTVLNNIRTLAAFRLSARQAELLAPHLFHISPLLTRRQRATGDRDLYNYADALPQYRQKVQELPDRRFFLRHSIAPARLVHTVFAPMPATTDVSEILAKVLRRHGRPRAAVAAELARRHRQLLAGNFSDPEVPTDDWH